MNYDEVKRLLLKEMFRHTVDILCAEMRCKVLSIQDDGWVNLGSWEQTTEGEFVGFETAQKVFLEFAGKKYPESEHLLVMGVRERGVKVVRMLLDGELWPQWATPYWAEPAYLVRPRQHMFVPKGLADARNR